VKFTIVKSKAHFTGATRASLGAPLYGTGKAVNKILQTWSLSKSCRLEESPSKHNLELIDRFSELVKSGKGKQKSI